MARRPRRSPGEDAAVPVGFEAVAEALTPGARAHVTEACGVVGRLLSDGGVSLGESLERLRWTTRATRRRDPEFAETRALALAWNEATLEYLHGLSCVDPLTGLSTHAHLRDRLSELYRDAAAGNHALVVTEARLVPDPIASAQTLTMLGQTARSVFPAAEAIGHVGRSRVVVVAPRDEALPVRVSLLRRMASEQADRVWIEGLPQNDAWAATLLDELAR